MGSLASYFREHRESREESIARMTFRYNPESVNPKTSLHTIHTWSGEAQTWCVCGRFHRDDPRLLTVARAALQTFGGLHCKRCTWHIPDADRRLLPTKGEHEPK